MNEGIYTEHKNILYFLIGLKGSGKTHIGNLVNAQTDIRFLRVESIWMSLQPGENGWQKVEQAIDQQFLTDKKIMVESLGVGEGFQAYFQSLSRKYSIKLIHIVADKETCLQRVRTRNQTEHMNISDAQVKQYNDLAADVHLHWDLEIINDPPCSDERILSAINSLDKNVDSLSPQSL